jgi:hypothetical protein
LTGWVPIDFNGGTNYVDAAIAEVSDTSLVNPNIDYIGPFDGSLVTVSPEDIVQKTGRTTSHTMGFVNSINNTISVDYMTGTAIYEGQIGIEDPCGGKFSDGGDSGSLIVTIPGPNDGLPKPVGLLFAGGSASGKSITFANPIGTVLTALTTPNTSTHPNNWAPSNNGTGQPTGTLSMVTGTPISTPYTSDSYNTYASSCSSGGGGPGGGNGGGGGGHGGGKPNDVRRAIGLDKAASVKKSHSQEIMALANVVGHGIGVDEDGNAVINIYVSKDSVGSHYPAQIEGVNVRVIEIGPIKAY